MRWFRAASGMSHALIVGLLAIVTIGTVAWTGEEVRCLFEKSADALGRAHGQTGSAASRRCGLVLTGFAFAPATGRNPGAQTVSESITIGGFNDPLTLILSSPVPVIGRVDGVVQPAGPIRLEPGQTLQLEVTADPGFGVTLPVTLTAPNGQTAIWTVTTRDQDQDASFSFADRTGVAPGSSQSITVTPTGYDGPVTVSVSGDGSPSLSLGGRTPAGSGSLSPPETLTLTVTASDSFEGVVVATVQMGTGPAQTWRVTTRAEDAVPDSFSFPSRLFTPPGSSPSASVTVGGFDGTIPVSVSGHGTARIQINGGSWVTSGSISAGQSLAVQLTNNGSATAEERRQATVTLGSGAGAVSAGFEASNQTLSYGGWSGWSSCSASCGSGTQTQSRSCLETSPSGLVGVSGTRCESAGLGPSSQSQGCSSTCNTYSWQASGSWSSCSISGSGAGMTASKSRSVWCRHDQSGSTVSDGFCGGGRPADTTSCSRTTQYLYVTFQQVWKCWYCGGPDAGPVVNLPAPHGSCGPFNGNSCGKITSCSPYPGCSGVASGTITTGVAPLSVSPSYFGTCTLGYASIETHTHYRYCFE